MFKYVLVSIFALCCVCHISVAHDEFPSDSIDREHLSGDALKGYLHGHICKIPNTHPDRVSDWVVNWGYFDYDPEIDNPHEKAQANWEESGCVSTDADGNRVYDHDCYNQYIREQGLTPTSEKPTGEGPSGEGPSKLLPNELLRTDDLLGDRTEDVDTEYVGPSPPTDRRQIPKDTEITDTGTSLPTEPEPITSVEPIDPTRDMRLKITHITSHTKPYFIKVYVLNNTNGFIGAKDFIFVLEDGSGEIKYQAKSNNEQAYFTYQGVPCHKDSHYRNEEGICANNAFAMRSYWAAKNWDVTKHAVRFAVGRFHKFGSKENRYNPDTDVVKILYQSRDMEAPVVIAQFPEPVEVPAAPMLQKGSMATKWAVLKQR